MEDMELICLQIISNAGEARSESMAALAAARNSRFDEAGEHLAAAGEKMKEAHHVHTRLITMDASGELDKIGLIMIHSEDISDGAEIDIGSGKGNGGDVQNTLKITAWRVRHIARQAVTALYLLC